MPEQFTDTPGGDELDFRPLPSQSTQRKPTPQPRAAAGSDGINFQPASATQSKTPRAASKASDEIDFQPAEKPATFDSLYRAPQQSPSVTERAAHAGEPSPDVRALAPKSADLSRVPIDPFTNRYVTGPPIATEEEQQRAGTIRPREQTVGERVQRALGAGAPEGSKVAEWTGQPGTKDNVRLFAPEQLMTEAEQQRHPILTGAGEFAGGMTSPESLALIGLTAGAGELAGPGAAVAKRLLSAGFSVPMLVNAARLTPQIADAFKRGDTATGERLLTQAVLSAGTAGLAGRGMFEETAPASAPAGAISSKLMMDDALARGGRRLQDFQANDAARRGMGNLADAERGIEAQRQARIDAPVEIPPTREEPAILPGRPQGPERNPLEVEAGRVREERAERERPAYTVRDFRRVVPEDSSQAPYYVLGGAPEPTPQGAGVVKPDAGELVGARGRSKSVSELASRVFNEQDNSLLQRFGPDVLDEARQELSAAAGLASSFERPGRYFSSIGQTEEMIPQRSQSSAKGIHAGGTWYGVGSARDMIRDMHPWYADVAEGPETLSKTVQEGRGAAYDRLLERAATHIQNEHESARPVIEEFAPQLRSLADQVRDTDPELAQSMVDLAEGHTRGFKNLRQYIEGKITDAQSAAEFSRAIDEAAAEARSEAGVEEAAQPRGATREAESASARELDFQPFPEPQAINPQEVEDMSRLLGRPVTAEELPGIRRRLEAERNVEAGLRGERRDVAGEIREEHRTQLEKQGKQDSRPAELYSGIHPRALVEGARVLQRVWDEKVAQPLINKVLKIGDKYQKAREADPAVAEGLHLLDNAPTYLRQKAAQQVHSIIGDLSRAQERLFTLLADADSRENLRTNHPDEYRKAMKDSAIQDALRKYRPIEQEMTRLRGSMGGEVLDQDYLRRVYDQHIAGINQREAPSSTGERGTSAYDRVIRPQRIGNLSREATAEYHYEHGLHEFGPAFATKFIGTHLRALRDQVAREFIGNATMLQAGASEPRFIMYNGERYYRPDVVREMRDAGQKGVKEYDRYDPTAGEKFPVPADGKFLGPRELVKVLTDYGRKEDAQPGAVRRFFQEQILGFGFGVPHIANIMRRVSQSVPGGAANPKGWVESWRVVLSKELRERGISGLNDPTFDMLAKHGAISTGEFANLKEYWGGNLNPANWARSLAQVGHEVLFNPEAAKGFGGLDQRARLYIADLVRSERPELTDAQIAAAVRTQLGDYNRANWTDRQKLLAKFMMFPGWDFSSVKWVLQHPIKTTVPPALVVLLANQALHQLGQNRAEDQYDISNIHVGDRSYGTSLLRESVARNLFRPAIGYAQAKLRGESDARAMDESARGATAGAGGLLSMLRPDLSGFVALATNRQGLFTGKEIVGREDYDMPGRILPSRAVEKQAVFAVRKAIPALDRLLDSSEETDWRSFAGGNLGVPNYRDDAEKRLIRSAGEADRVHQVLSRLAKSDPKQAREYVKDPDNAAFALFHHDLQQMASTLRRMDQAKEAIQNSGLPDADKQKRLETIENSRRNLLQHADWLNNTLFERREKGKPADRMFAPGFLGRLGRSLSPQMPPR
jgi:hypothetical protein